MKHLYRCRYVHCIHLDCHLLLVDGMSDEALTLFLITLPLTIESWKTYDHRPCIIKSLSIEGGSYTKEMMNVYMDCIRVIPSLHSMSLFPKPHSKGMSDALFISLCDCLADGCFPQLDTFLFPYHYIHDRGVVAFASLFLQNHLMRCDAFDFSYCGIHKKGIRALSALFQQQSLTASIQSIKLEGVSLHGNLGVFFIQSIGREHRPFLRELNLESTDNQTCLL